MEKTSKQKGEEEKEMEKQKTDELKEESESEIEVLEPAESVNLGSGVKRKLTEDDVSEPGTSDTGSSIASAIRANNSRTTTPPVFNNRFTRMKLKREVLIRTNKGFLEFFNLNSHLTLKKCWEEQPDRNKKGDFGKKD